MENMGLRDWYVLACLVAAVPPLVRACRLQYFECPAKADEFYEWVAHSFPEVWAGLPKRERSYLNPQFAINRIRREGLIRDPEFERRWEEVRRHRNQVMRPLLQAGAFVLLAIAPFLLNSAFGTVSRG